ncbi:MAG TPA: molybdate ABC transporter permease subunit [Deltaproteobacteria bacterium]|nr:molybdate ABC transporter permease subunit [Deltaproteobacteria bacterium]
MDIVPLILSFKLALVTTVMLVIIASPITYLIVYFRFPGKTFLDAFINLPIVLPPTVLGFYLLIWLGSNSSLGGLWESVFGMPLLFTFSAIVIASLIYNLPFAIQPMKAAFEKIDNRLLESAYILGLSRMKTFFRVIIPNSIPGIIASAILVFVHTMGEFGVILMVGGSIPGKTRVASIAIYEAVEALRYQDALFMSLALIPISYLFLLLINRLNMNEVKR